MENPSTQNEETDINKHVDDEAPKTATRNNDDELNPESSNADLTENPYSQNGETNNKKNVKNGAPMTGSTRKNNFDLKAELSKTSTTVNSFKIILLSL